MNYPHSFTRPLRSISAVVTLLAVVAAVMLPFSQIAFAASLTTLSDTQTEQTASTLSSHDISFVTPTGITAGQTITLTFDNSTSISASLATADVSLSVNAAAQTVAVGSNGASTWGFARTSATVITITSQSSGTPAAAGATIRIRIGTAAGGTNRITNGSAGTTVLTIAGSMADTGMIAEPVVSNDVVNITATVTPTITFSISDNTIGFGTLSASTARYATGDTLGQGTDVAAHTVAVATNAASGYSISIQGASLTSGSNVIAPIGATSAASSPGNEQFGIYATESGGSNNTVAAKYSDSVTPKFAYGATATTADTLGSGTSATATATYSVHYLANISGSTKPGSYAANLTYIATPQF